MRTVKLYKITAVKRLPLLSRQKFLTEKYPPYSFLVPSSTKQQKNRQQAVYSAEFELLSHNALYFYFFPRTRLLKQPVHGISRAMAQNTRCDVLKCLFGVHTMTDNILGFKFPKKPSQMAFYKHVRASANRLKTNDVIEDWRHWLRYLAACHRGRGAYTIYSVWEITAAVYFQEIKDYIRHGNSVLASVYSICRQYLLYRVLHKMISCAVWLESFKKMEILIRKRWTFEEPFD